MTLPWGILGGMERGLPDTLKKVMSAVGETEKENPPLWGMGMVAATITVNFFSTFIQKDVSQMVMGSHSGISPALATLILALLQVGAAAVVFRVGNLSFSSSSTNREAVIVAVAAHACGVFLTDYRLWRHDTAASVTYGAQEPSLCILLLLLAAGISTDSFKIGAVVAMSLGTALLTADFSLFFDRIALLRVLASLFFLVRNLSIKHLYDSSVTVSLRGQSTILSAVVCATVSAVILAMTLSQGLLVAAVLVVVACVLSVTLLHLIFSLLSMYDTLTVAVFMLWAQVVENVFFVGNALRPDIIAVILGAMLFAGGHYIYFKDGLDSGTVHLNIKKVSVNELFTRLEFILYTACIVGLFFTIFQPKVSERDMNVLSYIGLDRLARKLLNVEPDQH
ncbi:hypothetical protein BaRGS_00035819 [Batillaria attramentaria]|uniref:Uncharacterized protein n=1 Tax=Batillaria attramentaria TaxID=370345 RepID=A0ABD0JDQ6_9CAEN